MKSRRRSGHLCRFANAPSRPSAKRPKVLRFLLLALLTGCAIVYFLFPGVLLQAYRIWQRHDAGLQRRVVEVQDWRIPYLDSAPGGEAPVVLLLHGFGDTKDNFHPLAEGIVPEYRIIAPDLPGFGETAIRPEAAYPPELYVDTVLKLLDRLQIGSVHLVGYSMGGIIAVQLAARVPQRVRSLTLLAPAGLKGDELSEFDKLLQTGNEVPLVYRDRKEFERVLKLNFNRMPDIPGFAVRALVRDGTQRADVFAKIFATMLAELDAATFEQDVASLTMPVLVLIGEDDRIVDSSVAARWRAVPPDAQVRVLPDASHALVHQRGERIREILLSRLRSLERSGD